MFKFLGPLRPPAAGNGGSFPSYPPSRATPREIALQRELDELRAQQAALVREEREAAANVGRLQDSLDILAGEIDRRSRAVRDPELRQRGERMIANAKRLVRRGDARGMQPTTFGRERRRQVATAAASQPERATGY
jgi:hypothetical protein